MFDWQQDWLIFASQYATLKYTAKVLGQPCHCDASWQRGSELVQLGKRGTIFSSLAFRTASWSLKKKGIAAKECNSLFSQGSSPNPFRSTTDDSSTQRLRELMVDSLAVINAFWLRGTLLTQLLCLWRLAVLGCSMNSSWNCQATVVYELMR